MPRYKLTLEYDGSGFVGWQRQENGPSIQEALEDAVERYCGERVTAVAGGRTDAGVHARGQVAHFDLESPREPDEVRDAINHHLRPAPISLLAVEHAGDGFHARFSATERVYRYRIVNRRGPLALDRGRAWWASRTLDAEAMHAAAQHLVGRHDFSTFRSAECQASSPVKTLDELSVERRGDEIAVNARARSFLHRQVRNMVGALAWVGNGKWTAEDVAAALAARDRRSGGPTAPAHGLYLVAVRY